MKFKVFLYFIFLILLLAAYSCADGEDDIEVDGDADDVEEDAELWDAGEDPNQDGSGYGYGEEGGLPTGVKCEQDPCLHGKCVEKNGAAWCQCEDGYAGTYCEICAEGYEPDGLECVEKTPCSDYECGQGLCKVEEEQPVCYCDTGYTGDHCDECDEGYHEENLVCIPD